MNVEIPNEDIRNYIEWYLDSKLFVANHLHGNIIDLFEQFYTRNDKLPVASPEDGYYVEIIEYGDKKIACIKIIRRFTGLGLKEAKSAVEGYYPIRDYTFTEAGARAFCRSIEEHGGAATYHSTIAGRW